MSANQFWAAVELWSTAGCLAFGTYFVVMNLTRVRLTFRPLGLVLTVAAFVLAPFQLCRSLLVLVDRDISLAVDHLGFLGLVTVGVWFTVANFAPHWLYRKRS